MISRVAVLHCCCLARQRCRRQSSRGAEKKTRATTQGFACMAHGPFSPWRKLRAWCMASPRSETLRVPSTHDTRLQHADNTSVCTERHRGGVVSAPDRRTLGRLSRCTPKQNHGHPPQVLGCWAVVRHARSGRRHRSGRRQSGRALFSPLLFSV